MVKRPDYIPANYPNIKVVGSLTELFNAEFGEANCILFPRPISGEFNQLAKLLKKHGTEKLYDEGFVPQFYWAERRLIIDDMKAIRRELQERGVNTGSALRVETSEGWIESQSPCAYHVEGCSKPEIGRILCSYNEPVTEWLRNEDAVNVPQERIRDLYKAKEGATIQRFRPGDIFRIKSMLGRDMTSNGEGCFIHRAPEPTEETKHLVRMLLVAG